jgi:hypothetical protein
MGLSPLNWEKIKVNLDQENNPLAITDCKWMVMDGCHHPNEPKRLFLAIFPRCNGRDYDR